MNKIAIIGYGSLIWDPRNLQIDKQVGEDGWHVAGLTLPVEFARLSSRDRLTLIITEEFGQECPVFYALSTLRNLNKAIGNLHEREGSHEIGYFNLKNGTGRRHHCSPGTAEKIRLWAIERHFDGVIWTDLERNFPDGGKVPFSVEKALEFLEGLGKKKSEAPREYFEKAPKEINTPLRRAVADQLWPHEFNRQNAGQQA